MFMVMGSQTAQTLGVTDGIVVLVLAMQTLKIVFPELHRVLAIAWQDFVKQYVRLSIASRVMSAAKNMDHKQGFLKLGFRNSRLLSSTGAGL